MKTNHCIDVCNRLLRGEQSAVAAYAQATVALKDTPEAVAKLKEILQEHRDAVLTLTENVRSMGGESSPDSGAWGAFATTVQGAANALGHEASIASLKTGEKAGKLDYETALKDDEVMPECKEMIRSNLLPAVERHIQALDAMKM